MDLQPSQNNYSEEDRLQTSESLSGFFSRMTVSNKTMERIMRQDSNLSPYDGFRIGGIGKVLNQIGLNQRKHHIIYKVSSGEFAIPMEFTGNVMEMQLIPKEEILEELSRLREEIAVTMKWIHIGTIEVVIKATFKEGIDSEIHLSIMDRRINNLRDGCLGAMIGNLYAGKLMFDIHPRIAYNLADQDFSRALTLHQDFKRKDLMKEGNRPYSITYRIAYALSNTHHSDLFLRKEYIEIPRISRNSLRYEGMLEIAGHEILVTGVAGRENGSMILGISFLEDHKPWGRKGTATGTHRYSNFYEESEEEIKNLKEAMQELKIMDISEESQLSLENVKRLIQRNFSENPLAWWDRNKIEATLKIKEECKYDSPGFLVRNHGEIKRGKPRSILWRKSAISPILKDKKHLQSFLGVVNFAGIFIKDLAKYRKDFRPLLKEMESAKWKWEEIHTQRVGELKQVCNNLPKLVIPQDEDELVVYTDANDYRWAAVLMKKTTTGKSLVDTRRLFTEQQAQMWHINEKEFFAVWKAFKKWPLFLLAKEFTLKVDNTNVKAFLKNKLESKIEKAQMEASEANSIMLRLRHLRENLEELNKKFGRLAVNAQVAGQIQRADLDTVQIAIRTTMVASTSLWNDLQEPIRKASYSEMTNELRKHDTKHALRVQDSRPVAADSSTACTRPSPDSGVTATNESQGVQTSDDSSQPSASGVKEEEISLRPMTGTSKANTNELLSSSSAWQVYQQMWKKLISRKGVNTSKTIIEISGKYNRVWMIEGSKPEEVREWYEFGALASVHTMSPSFPEISKLSDWISGARPDTVAFNRIKVASEEAPLVSAISEDDISTRRAWGLWVCLTEMDKVKYPFKIFSNKVNGSFLLNSMTGRSTEFAESMFEKKRMLIWENKLPATEATRMKRCNMLHVGQWHNHVCPCCEK
ncbi:movement protein [Sesamum angolense]|uniref:Movement protein n=1 Tax=Sesamum angolense TaxID=2727404 RepID=A0AAE1W3P1_9LAMI|nr:movement protein [Sesamum angolense]